MVSPGYQASADQATRGKGRMVLHFSVFSIKLKKKKNTFYNSFVGFVAENGDLELRDVNAKDTGNYTCVITYVGPDNEEPVETTYEIHLQGKLLLAKFDAAASI